MKTSPAIQSPGYSLAASAALWAPALLIAASVAGLWFLLAQRSPGVFFALAALLALSAAGLFWVVLRGRASRRFRAALDAHADSEIGRQRRWKATRRARPFPMPSE